MQQKILKTFLIQDKKLSNFFNDYAKIRSEAMFKTKHGRGLKILTPNKTLQR